MTETQQKHLVAAAQNIAAALGPNVAADKPANLQTAMGLAFILARTCKTAPMLAALGQAARHYLPEPAPEPLT